MSGFIAARATAEGEFQTPLYADPPDTLAVVRLLVEVLRPFLKELNRIDDPETIGDSCQLWQCDNHKQTRSRITYGNMRAVAAALSDPRLVRLLADAKTGR